MRLLPVWVLTVAGWVVSAAPGPAHTTAPAHDTSPPAPSPSTHTPPPHPDQMNGADLGPALKDLARRKRGNTKVNLPYSNYRPTSGIHRYRYPLYKKRSSSYSPQYDYQDDLLLPEDDYPGYRELEPDYDTPSPLGYNTPSLFRERNLKRSQLLEDDGYFTDDYYPFDDEDDNVGVETGIEGLGHQLARRQDYYNRLYNLPYSDLQRLNQMYEIAKRDSDLTSLDLPPAVRGQLHGVGRKTYVPTATERFYDAIDYIKGEEDEARRRKKKSQGVSKRGGLDFDLQNGPSISGEKLRKLQNYLTSTAGRYWQGREAELGAAREARMDGGDPAELIRKKRKVASSNTTKASSVRSSSSSSSSTRSNVRGKRAFSDYFRWEKRDSTPYDDDYLTREYFKSIARSVGQKKKRMAYAQFEAPYPEASKRSMKPQVTTATRSNPSPPPPPPPPPSQPSSSVGQDVAANKRSKKQVKRTGYNLDEVLRNPSMLRYMQDRLKEAEEAVAREAEGDVREGDVDQLISNVVVRLDALERMRGALRQLEELQEDSDAQEDRRKKKREEEELWRKKAEEEVERRKMEGKEKKSGRRRLRRGDGDLTDLFLGSSREDCPVLERLVVNCEGVSAEVGDEDQVFLPHCLRHEICYMCGSGQSVTGHECDAILSSGLESACAESVSIMPSGSLDCLGAAGNTFNHLSDHSRYDNNGVCTQDPCVRRFLESR
ncbi:hypothetical protein Pmani_032328 [Petrolisthes manimaculis]|uniref:Uncharacterized protein n=1 Tax=Petrolisthes manimaculis TaxID=1843537 RepID=A0AAE1NRZ8_9EUCA|nr:hypothetical protein Pmani_032328 [Petrolisthes manimaculis]